MSNVTPARAAALADDHARAIGREFAESVERHGPGVAELCDAVFERRGEWPHTEFPRGKRATIHSTAYSAAMARLWRRHRIVYTVDADLTEELRLTDTSDVIPSGLVRQLPHPDPYLAFPEPIRVPLGGEPGYAESMGAFLYALDAHGLLISTAHPHAATVGVLIVGDVHDEHGRKVRHPDGQVAHTWTRTTLPAEPTSIADAAMDMHTRMMSSAATQTGEGMPLAADMIEQTLSRVVPILIYLCAANADTRPVPAVATRTKPDGSAYRGKAPTVVEFGYRIGPRLGRARRSYPVGAAGTTGRKVAPHVRRAHFHTYMTGPGRTVPTVRWLAPIPINVDKDAAKTVVVPGPSKKSPAAPPAR